MTDADNEQEHVAEASQRSDAGPVAYEDVSLTEMKAFIGDDEYAHHLHVKLQENARLAGFNVWAAFFGCAWFAYRKLYVQGLGALALEVAIPSILGAIPLIVFTDMDGFFVSNSVVIAAFIGVRVGVGFWANTVLNRKAVQTIREVDALNLDNDAHVQMIAACGRVSVAAFFIAIGITGVANRLVLLGL